MTIITISPPPILAVVTIAPIFLTIRFEFVALVDLPLLRSNHTVIPTTPPVVFVPVLGFTSTPFTNVLVLLTSHRAIPLVPIPLLTTPPTIPRAISSTPTVVIVGMGSLTASKLVGATTPERVIPTIPFPMIGIVPILPIPFRCAFLPVTSRDFLTPSLILAASNTVQTIIPIGPPPIPTVFLPYTAVVVVPLLAV